VADTLKVYFRELPEPLLTSKFSELLVTLQESEWGWGWGWSNHKGAGY